MIWDRARAAMVVINSWAASETKTRESRLKFSRTISLGYSIASSIKQGGWYATGRLVQ